MPTPKDGLEAYERGDYEGAIAIFDALIPTMEGRVVLAMKTRLAFALYRRGQQIWQSDPDQADALAGRSIELCEEIPPLAKFEGGWLVKACVAGLRGDKEQQMTCLEMAILANPKSAMALGNKASILNNAGELEEALALCAQAIAAHEALWYPHFIRACVLAKMGRADEAIDEVELALKSASPENRLTVFAEEDLKSIKDHPRFPHPSETN